MDASSAGPTDRLPPSDTKERASLENAEAQRVNEADSRHGLAGAEAKPFAGAGDGPVVPDPAGEEETASDASKGLVSGRRNAGRDDASDAAGRPPERDAGR